MFHNIEQMNDRTKNILVSIVQGLVSLPFLMGGTMKLITPYEALGAEPNMGWGGVRFVPRIGAGSTPEKGGLWS